LHYIQAELLHHAHIGDIKELDAGGFCPHEDYN